MKHIKYIPIIVLLTACSGDEVVDTTTVDPNEIRINVSTTTSSRATNLLHNASLQNNFSLFAVKANTAESSDFDTYLDNETINYASSGFSFADGKRYWPENDKPLNFYAFHFCSNDEVSKTTDYPNLMKYNSFDTPKLVYDSDHKCVGVSVTNVKMPTETERYTGNAEVSVDDMLYAVSKHKTKSSNSGNVQLNFRHATAKILFKATSPTNEHLYIITRGYGSEIHGFKNKGDLFFGFDETSSNISSDDNYNDSYSDQCYWKLDETDDGSDNYISYRYRSFALTSIGGGNNNMKTTAGSREYYILPQKFVPGHYDAEQGKWIGLYMRFGCAIFYIEDATGLLKYLGDYNSFLLGQGNEAVVKGTEYNYFKSVKCETCGPYGVMIFGNPDAIASYKYTNSEDKEKGASAMCKDLYIPLPEIEGGFKAGRTYLFDLQINLNSTGITAYNEDGTDAFIPVDLSVKEVSDWIDGDSIDE